MSGLADWRRSMTGVVSHWLDAACRELCEPGATVWPGAMMLTARVTDATGPRTDVRKGDSSRHAARRAPWTGR